MTHAEITYTNLTAENAAGAKMPAGLLYGDRCRWIAKRDQLVRAAQAAPVAAAPSRAAVASVLLEARAACADNARWLRAANKAAVELDTGAWAYNGRVLVVKSRTSARQYRCTAQTCECAAFAKSAPCWHRAAARLVERAARLAA